MSFRTTKSTGIGGFCVGASGSALPIFGLTFLPVMLILGVAADYGNLAMNRSALQQATDVSTLTIAAKLRPTATNSTTLGSITGDATTTQLVQAVLNAQQKMAAARVKKTEVLDNGQTLCTTTQLAVPTAFMRIAHFETMTAEAKACASLGGGSSLDTNYEIALVFDNSGSMTRGAGAKTKIDALKFAAAGFVNSLYKKIPANKMHFSVTPFAGGVVAVDPSVAVNRALPWIDVKGDNSQHWIVFGGKAAAAAQNFTSRFDIFDSLKDKDAQLDWRGCFETPTYPNNVRDITPTVGDPETLFVPYLAPDEPDSYPNDYLDEDGGACAGPSAGGEWGGLTRVCKYRSPTVTGSRFSANEFKGSNMFCPDSATQTLLQLTATQSEVLKKIDQLVANGNTNLHEGFMWGWRSISPNGPFAGGRPYGDSHNRKVMIFMTDGFNHWSAYPGKAGGSDYEMPGYYSYNGVANVRFPDGSHGDGVNYQSLLAPAGGSRTNYHDLSRDMQDELTRQACANAKAAGVEVFTIGFSVPTDPIDRQGLDLMKNCATNIEHYYEAKDAEELNFDFVKISVALGRLRLSQ